MNVSQKEIPFLDLLVIKNSTKLRTDIYAKPTDTKKYLLFSSCHPRHIKTGIPNTLATRLKIIVSDEDTLKKQYQGLKGDLLKRGYPDRVIVLGISIANAKCRKNLLNPTRNDTLSEVSLPIVTTHNSNGFNLFTLVKTLLGH